MRDRLVGRDDELALIERFLAPADRTASPVLVFSGEPGVGKTALLDAAVDIAEQAGRRAVRATALEYEVELGFGALNQVLLPLSDALPALDDVHRHAIAVMCGLESGPPPTQLVAGAAALALVSASARSTPLLIVVDDVPWLDLPSGMVLTYLARRLLDADVRLLVAARSELENVFVRSGFDAHIISPLADGPADELLASRFPELRAGIRERIRRDAAGNPLALLDLPAALDSGRAPTTDPLPLTERLNRVYADRLNALPPRTGELLLLLVLAGTENASMLESNQASGAEAVASAEQSGILRRNPRSGRTEFRHPLIRSAVFERSTIDERRVAHSALAQTFADDPQRHAWHLGQSVSGPDESVARTLELVADEMLHSGGGAASAAAMLRAAELSPAPAGRSRRLARAAYLGSAVTGDLQGSPRLLSEGLPSLDESPSLAYVTAAAFHLLNTEGDASTAHRLLIGALENITGDLAAEDPEIVEALATLLSVCFYAARPDFAEAVRTQIARLRPAPPEALTLLDRLFIDPVRAEPADLRTLDAALDTLRFTSDPVRITRISTAAAHLDRLHLATEPLTRVIDDGRSGGAVAKEIEALFLLGNDRWFSGAWDDLERLADDGLALSEQLGYALTAAPGRFLRGMVDAARGREAAADRAAEQLLLWAAPRRLYALAAYASHIRCMLQLPHGRFESAYRHAASVSPPGVLLPFVPHAIWLVFDLVESAVRAGHLEEAAAHVDAATHLRSLSPRLDLLVTAAGALTTTGDPRDEFERALSVPGSERWSFDRARVQLVYGEQLRRDQAPGEARTQLTAALDAFRRLGAEPWSERSLRELKASGGSPPGRDALTPQEAAVARLAATGLTNKQIGTQLFLSPRTVSTHLSRVFPKLGIESRAALRDALDALGLDPE